MSGGVEISANVRLRSTDGGKIVLRDGVHLARGVTIIAQGGIIEIGENVFVGEWSTVSAKAGVSIGAESQIAERVSIRDQDHKIRGATDRAIRESGFEISQVNIGQNVWIAAGAVILKGALVGDDAVVGANAVVVKNVASKSIVGGVPAKEIGRRSSEDG